MQNEQIKTYPGSNRVGLTLAFNDTFWGALKITVYPNAAILVEINDTIRVEYDYIHASNSLNMASCSHKGFDWERLEIWIDENQHTFLTQKNLDLALFACLVVNIRLIKENANRSARQLETLEEASRILFANLSK